MKKIQIADTVSSASNYQMDDGRIYRIHLKLITPKEQLATSDFVEVETQGYEVTKSGAFVVDDDGMPVTIPVQRARIPLENVRNGNDSVKAGWVKQALVETGDELAALLAQHTKLKNIPKTGEHGDVKRVGDDLYSYTDGLYDKVREARLSEISKASTPVVFDEAQVSALIP